MKKLFLANKKIFNSKTKLNMNLNYNQINLNILFCKKFSSLFDDFKKEPINREENKNFNSKNNFVKKNLKEKTFSPFIIKENNQDDFHIKNKRINNNLIDDNISLGKNTLKINKNLSEFEKEDNNIEKKKINNFSKMKMNIPMARDGKPLSIFNCKSTEHIIGMYYTYKNYFNKDINTLAKVLIRFCQVANKEGLIGVDNLAKLRIIKELIKNLSEKLDIDNSQIFDNDVIVDIMKILRFNKIVERYKEKKDEDNNYRKKYKNINEDGEVELLIENFIIEKVLKNLNIKIFLKNLENANQMTSFIQNLTKISKITDLRKNFKFLFFKANILTSYDKISISKYHTRNLIVLLWALSNTNINLPDIYNNITDDLINRYEYLTFQNKINILFSSARQKLFNRKLIQMIFIELKNKISKEDSDFLFNFLLENDINYFKELIYFLNIWGQINKKIDSVMNEEIVNNIMKFIYFKFIKRRKNGDDLIFTEFDHEQKIHRIVLFENDRINILGFLLRYDEFSKNFFYSELCFEEIYLKKKKENQEKLKLDDLNSSNIDDLMVDSEEEERNVLNEINNDKNDLTVIDKTILKIDTLSEEEKSNKHYYEFVANKDRKYELDISNIIEEFISNFGYNIYGYIEKFGYNLLSLTFIDKNFKMLDLFKLIINILSDEHYKISSKEYIRICSLIPIFLKMIKVNEQFEKTSLNIESLESKNMAIKEKSLFFKILKSNKSNLTNFIKGIISENNLKYIITKQSEITIILDIIEIIDKVRIIDNQIYSKIVNIASEEIKCFLETNIINELSFDQILCINYLIIVIKVDLEKKISENIKKIFIEKFREDFGKNRYKPFKKILVNSLLYFTDKNLRTEISKSDPQTLNNQEISSKDKKLKKDFDTEFFKMINEETLENTKDKEILKLNDDLFNLDIKLNEFTHFDIFENLKLPDKLGIEERDINFSLSVYDKLDSILNSIKNLKYLTNKIFDNNYYIDYYLPKIKIGFLVYNSNNFFDVISNHKILLIEDFPHQPYLSMKPLAFRPLIDLYKTKYNVDLFVINEKILEYKSDDIIALIRKFNLPEN